MRRTRSEKWWARPEQVVKARQWVLAVAGLSLETVSS